MRFREKFSPSNFYSIRPIVNYHTFSNRNRALDPRSQAHNTYNLHICEHSLFLHFVCAGPSRGCGRGVSYPGPRYVLIGGPAVGEKYKIPPECTIFEKKNSNILFPDRPRENVWGPRENVSPGPAVALDGPVPVYVMVYCTYCRSEHSLG